MKFVMFSKFKAWIFGQLAFNFMPNSRFIAVMHADTDGIVPGNALVVSFEIFISIILNFEP